MNTPSSPIAVSGHGQVCCLGLDAVSACAAARAGLSRAYDLPLQVVDEETGEPVPVYGHAVGELSDGFEGTARVLRMVHLALADLRRGVPVPDPTASERCAWLFALPERVGGVGREGAPAPPDLRRSLEQVAESAGFAIRGPYVTVFGGGHAAFGSVLREALRLLRDGTVACCVVGAADSLLDSETLEALLADGRLKTADQPAGLRPGEGAAFFLLERVETAQGRGAPLLGRIDAVEVGAEEEGATERPPPGRELARLVGALGPVPEEGPAPLLVSDYNGEAPRAAEYGHVLFRLVARSAAFQDAQAWFPAVSFGDTGAASAALGLGMLLRGFARGYAPAREGLLLSSSDAGLRAAARVHAPA